MTIYYEFPEQKKEYAFEITPFRFSDYISSQYSASDLMDLVMNFYWDKISEDYKLSIQDAYGFNPEKPHELDYLAHELFIDILYDYAEDFEDGLYAFYMGEAHEECKDEIRFRDEFRNDSKWY